jgi:UDP-glucuronate decarboxylase
MKKILITGGAGFIGSHLVDYLMNDKNNEVIVIDNLMTGSKENIKHWLTNDRFTFILHDITLPIFLEVDFIYHLACPASPYHYQYNPIKTIKTNFLGTLNMLGLAKRTKARILLTSTSEVYGDPLITPQTEDYFGNVNPIGERACYDEGKRIAETLMYAYNAQNNVDIRVARIFNTYGPRMSPYDGRVVSNFIIQSLQNKDITIYGDGNSTRSFQYITDLVDGLIKLMHSNYIKPVNLGNPEEYTINKFSEIVNNVCKSDSKIIYLPATSDDPKQRKPDISVAIHNLNWNSSVKLLDGIQLTMEYFKNIICEYNIDVPLQRKYASINLYNLEI